MKISYKKAAKIFGKTAQLQVLVYLLNCSDEGEYQTGIAKATNRSHLSVTCVIDPLLEEAVVIKKDLEK